MAHSEHEEWLADEQARKAVHEKHHAPPAPSTSDDDRKKKKDADAKNKKDDADRYWSQSGG